MMINVMMGCHLFVAAIQSLNNMVLKTKQTQTLILKWVYT